MNKIVIEDDDYVSYGVARLLKEKGFDCECIGYYVDHEPNVVHYSFCGETNSTWGSRSCSAPTCQMAMRWLREVYKIFVEIGVSVDLNGEYHYGFRLLNSICKDILKPKDLVKIGFKDTYEKACEEAIKYCLMNLVK